MLDLSIVGADLAKRVFQGHGAWSSGDVVFRKKLPRSHFMKFLSEQSLCLAATASLCAGSLLGAGGV